MRILLVALGALIALAALGLVALTHDFLGLLFVAAGAALVRYGITTPRQR